MVAGDDLTTLLVAWGKGDRHAESRLVAAVYADLRQVARKRLRAEGRQHSLTPTALVHETYLRLADLRRIQWKNRAQFFAIAARVMRRVLVDHARARQAGKRGGGDYKMPLAEHLGVSLPPGIELLDLDAALTKLAATDARQAHLVELRFFAGLTVDEAAEVLKLSPATIKREWALARAWLFRELRGADGV
jgi:RNA polymerase sigma factor (TIGR02999 family)